MNQNIITYLNENKEKYSKDVLVAELHKAGYSEGDITEGVAQVFGLSAVAEAKEGGAVPVVASANTSFWNFKDKKVYTKASEKWADFLFGFFAPMIVGFIIRPLLTMFLWPIFFIAEIVVLVYLYNRRRFIFYGIMSTAIILPVIVILFIMVMFGGMHV